MVDSAFIVSALTEALPDGAVLTDPDLLELHQRDEADLCDFAPPLVVVRPRETADVQAVLRVASHHGVPVVPQGARTGLTGAANTSAGSIALDLTRMDRVLDVDPVNRTAVVQPGVVNRALRQAAEARGLRYPPDPGSWETSTIGGNVATNAGGMCCVKYGVTAEYVLGLEVVLADGEVLRCGRRTAKGVAGYDLVRLFVGSEGTLGVITEITVALRPIPDPALTLVAVFPTTSSAGHAVAAIAETGASPSLLELLDQVHLRAIERHRPMGLPTEAQAILLAASDTGLAEITRIAELCRAAGATDVYQATDAEEAASLLEARRRAHPAMERYALAAYPHGLGGLLIDDVAVPRSRLAEMLDGVARVAAERGIEIGVVAHAGDGNLHPNIIIDRADPANLAVAKRAFDDILALGLALGGTCTGEHGVGLLKREWLATELGPVGVRVHEAIKRAFDPQGILNPGKVL